MGTRKFLNPDSLKNVLIETAFYDFNPLFLQNGLFTKTANWGPGIIGVVTKKHHVLKALGRKMKHDSTSPNCILSSKIKAVFLRVSILTLGIVSMSSSALSSTDFE
ncbi:MAG: hypothetical protein OEM27_02000, partial [Nitrospinota bacterium]|nr:hypothetical protein [Nitrospinota bacterium]